MKEWIQTGEVDFLSADHIAGWSFDIDGELTFFFVDRPPIISRGEKYIRLFFEQFSDTHPGIAELWKLWEKQRT